MAVSRLIESVIVKIKDYGVMLLLMLICLVPSIAAFYNWVVMGAPIYIAISIFLLSLSLFLLPFLITKARTAFFINTIWILFSPLELVSLIFYKNSIKGGLVFLIFQSSLRESLEFLSLYKVYFFLYLFVLIAYLIIVFKYVKNENLLKQRKIRLFLFCGIILFYILLYVYSFKVVYDNKQNFKSNLKVTNIVFNLKFRKIYPYNAILAVYNGTSFYHSLKSTNKEAESFRFNAKQDKSSGDEREIYVFIIGETARYANFGINGYNRETTPLLKNIKNVYSFSNVYSEANSTEMSLPILLTRADARNFDVFKNEKTVVDVFKEAGFNTYWIANQSSGNTLIRRISNNTTLSYFAPVDFDDDNNFDEKLWMKFDEVLKRKEKKQFIVLHTLGSHFRYNMRYPQSFKKYVPALEGMTDNLKLGENIKTELINSYDNSILYTDYFLAGTIKRLIGTGAISYLFYTSDHAECLFDYDGIIFHGSLKPNVSELHVPMFVWMSDKYKLINDEKENAILNNENKKITSDIVFHSLLDMANIHFAGFSDKYISNKNLKSDSARFCVNSEGEVFKF